METINNNNDGYLELIIGPMFSGKTSRLIEIYNKFSTNFSVLVLNHCLDNRYHESHLSTHNKKMIPCIQLDSLLKILNNDNYKNSKIILINEGQFFNDLKDVVLEMVEKDKKTVYVCGLDSDFKRNNFGYILDLIPYSDNIVKLKALCKNGDCNKDALFSYRKNNTSKNQILVGSDEYIPLCRNCYISTT